MKHQILFLIFSCTAFFANSAEKMSSLEYIEHWKVTAIEQMNSHAIPASITLAQGILESGSGNSRLAQNANNHFGIKCHKNWDGNTFYQDDDEEDECFRSYDNAALSYQDHSLFLTSRDRYSGLFELRLTDYKNWAKGLKKAGYATNPQYANLLINIIEKYDLGQYDLMPHLPIEVEREKEQAQLVLRTEEESPRAILKKEEEKEIEVNFSNTHKVELNKNRTRYVVVKEGDTFYRISKEFNLGLWQLYKYNELGKRDVLIKGELIYLEPKRGHAKRGTSVFICTKTTTLREISQLEGIKLKKLLKYNLSENPDEELQSGTKVILR